MAARGRFMILGGNNQAARLRVCNYKEPSLSLLLLNFFLLLFFFLFFFFFFLFLSLFHCRPAAHESF